MCRLQHAIFVAAVLVTASILAPAASAQLDFGTSELGEIGTFCQVVCYSQTGGACDAAGSLQAITSEAPFFVRGVRRGPADQDLCNNPGLSEPVTFPVQLQAGQALIFDIDFVANQLGPTNGLVRIDDVPLIDLQANVVPAGPCPPSATDALCLVDDRFTVRVNWRTGFGTRDHARKVPGVSSDDSGLFYFFNPNNWEMLVKMVDACNPPFNRFWVFYAATTNVEFNLTVTDTQEQEVQHYYNPLGTAAPPVQDTQAFATCP